MFSPDTTACAAPLAPGREGVEEGNQRAAEGGEGVVDGGRVGGMDGAGEEAIVLEGAQVLGGTFWVRRGRKAASNAAWPHGPPARRWRSRGRQRFDDAQGDGDGADRQLPAGEAVAQRLMGADDVWQVAQAAPKATLIATHMEGVSHATLTRRTLRAFAEDNAFSARLLILADGETLVL